jgi:hypothetical protein
VACDVPAMLSQLAGAERSDERMVCEQRRT